MSGADDRERERLRQLERENRELRRAVEVPPTAERTEGNLGYRVLGPAPTP